MPAGKLASQAGHAFTDSLFSALDVDPDLINAYRRNGYGGSKVVLKAKNEQALLRAVNECESAGLPHALVVDRDHILPPFFDGQPIVTALGIGPCTREQCREITKRFRCV